MLPESSMTNTVCTALNCSSLHTSSHENESWNVVRFTSTYFEKCETVAVASFPVTVVSSSSRRCSFSLNQQMAGSNDESDSSDSSKRKRSVAAPTCPSTVNSYASPMSPGISSGKYDGLSYLRTSRVAAWLAGRFTDTDTSTSPCPASSAGAVTSNVS